MRTLTVAVFLIALGAVIAIWFAMDPGSASFAFRGWVVETSFAIVFAVLLVFAFLLALFWRGLGWVLGLPAKVRRSASEAKSRRGYDALERALIASAAGDGPRARRQAVRAGELLDRPLLTRVISARASEAAGEIESAETDYRLLLESPETEIVGRRGLAQAAMSRGDLGEARRQAAAAFSRNPQARWAFETLFEAQIGEARWADAQKTLAEGERQSHVGLDVARRRRAVLLTAEAAEAESAADYDHARERAVAATQAFAGFAPGAALAARLLQRDGNVRKAMRVLEDSWRAAPHPALALRWRELKPAVTGAEEAAHLERLVRLAPDNRESRILAAEAALKRGEAEDAAAIVEAIPGHRTARLYALQARIAEAEGDDETARNLVLQAVGAPGEADWSDVDPDGPAFEYSEEDWARLVYVFGEDEVLIHPRHERYERELIAAPSLKLIAPPPPPVPPAEPAPIPEAKPAPDVKSRPGPETEAGDEAEPSSAQEAPKSPPPAASPPSPDDPGPGAETWEDDSVDFDPRK